MYKIRFQVCSNGHFYHKYSGESFDSFVISKLNLHSVKQKFVCMSQATHGKSVSSYIICCVCMIGLNNRFVTVKTFLSKCHSKLRKSLLKGLLVAVYIVTSTLKGQCTYYKITKIRIFYTLYLVKQKFQIFPDKFSV